MSEPIGLEPEKAVITDASNIIIENVVEQLLIDLVKKSLNNEEFKNKISIKLTPEVLTTINNIISVSPNTFADIEKGIQQVIKDGKIDSNDIPQLIIIIQVLYRLVHSLKNISLDTKKRSDIVSSALKYIVHLMVLEGKIHIDKSNEELFLKETDILIDSCISLLSFPKSIKTPGCLKKIFG
jgi:hypothetical protein